MLLLGILKLLYLPVWGLAMNTRSRIDEGTELRRYQDTERSHIRLYGSSYDQLPTQNLELGTPDWAGTLEGQSLALHRHACPAKDHNPNDTSREGSHPDEPSNSKKSDKIGNMTHAVSRGEIKGASHRKEGYPKAPIWKASEGGGTNEENRIRELDMFSYPQGLNSPGNVVSGEGSKKKGNMQEKDWNFELPGRTSGNIGSQAPGEKHKMMKCIQDGMSSYGSSVDCANFDVLSLMRNTNFQHSGDQMNNIHKVHSLQENLLTGSLSGECHSKPMDATRKVSGTSEAFFKEVYVPQGGVHTKTNSVLKERFSPMQQNTVNNVNLGNPHHSPSNYGFSQSASPSQNTMHIGRSVYNNRVSKTSNKGNLNSQMNFSKGMIRLTDDNTEPSLLYNGVHGMPDALLPTSSLKRNHKVQEALPEQAKLRKVMLTKPKYMGFNPDGSSTHYQGPSLKLKELSGTILESRPFTQEDHTAALFLNLEQRAEYVAEPFISRTDVQGFFKVLQMKLLNKVSNLLVVEREIIRRAVSVARLRITRQLLGSLVLIHDTECGVTGSDKTLLGQDDLLEGWEFIKGVLEKWTDINLNQPEFISPIMYKYYHGMDMEDPLELFGYCIHLGCQKSVSVTKPEREPLWHLLKEWNAYHLDISEGEWDLERYKKKVLNAFLNEKSRGFIHPLFPTERSNSSKQHSKMGTNLKGRGRYIVNYLGDSGSLSGLGDILSDRTISEYNRLETGTFRRKVKVFQEVSYTFIGALHLIYTCGKDVFNYERKLTLQEEIFMGCDFLSDILEQWNVCTEKENFGEHDIQCVQKSIFEETVWEDPCEALKSLLYNEKRQVVYYYTWFLLRKWTEYHLKVNIWSSGGGLKGMLANCYTL